MVPPQLRTERFVLRKFKRSDASALAQAVRGSLPELKVWLPWANRPYRGAQARSFIRESKKSWRENNAYDFTIRHPDAPGQHLGNVSIWRVSSLARSGEIGYWIRSDMTGQGVGTEVTARLLKLGFEELRLNKVMLRIGVGNHPSVRIAYKLGFREEGIMRQELLLNGSWIDHILFSILASEWEPGQPIPADQEWSGSA